jgi:predicted O-linked N-acetylglucosamine transferase (SPINDLY family)
MTPDKLAAALDHHRAGRLAEAEQLYREIVQCDPRQADAWHLLGMVAHQRGNHATGVRWIAHAISLCGDYPDYHNNLASAHYSSGNYAAAEAASRQAIRLQPTFFQAHNNLGNALHAQGETDEALVCYREAVRLNPGYTLGWANAAIACRSLGRLAEAVSCYRSALQFEPDSLQLVYNLGVTLQEMGCWEESVSCLRRAASLDPQFSAALVRLAVSLRHLGYYREAAECLRQAIACDPQDAHAHNDLGELLWRAGERNDAIGCFRRAVAIMPPLATAHYNLANALHALCQLDEAEESYRIALAVEPDSAAVLTNLAITLSDMGRTEEARELFQRAHQLAPDNARAHSHLLVIQHYLAGATLESLGKAHAEWNRRHADKLTMSRRRYPSAGTLDRPLKLGLVSRDFRRHPVGFFLAAVLESLDRGRFEVTCYADQVECDEMTQRLQAAARGWRSVHFSSDSEIAEMVRHDQIDILVDLAGHTAGHRLLVFARKPAPVQGTWMGYVGTTGLPAIDFLISDRYHTPVGMEDCFAEEVLLLPDGYVCYSPPPNAPPVNELPARNAGILTFGSFNNPAKLSEETVVMWGEILRRTESRLLLKYPGLDSRGATNHILDRFAGHGIDVRRINLEGAAPHHELLARYHALDVALDTYPYSGGLTTCESLWMGVPVVTRPGDTFASRHALSHLSNAGLPELVAQNAERYVELAIDLATDTHRLAQFRSELRDRVARSRLCDSQRFTRAFEEVLLKVWQKAAAGG